jgi:multicomponent Na+:H+ antiporter subunit D
MTATTLLPLLVMLSSLVPALLIFLLREDQHRLRTILNLGGALLKVGVVGIMLWGVFHEKVYALKIPFLPGLPLALEADALSMFFITLSAVLWLATTIYAIGYLEGEPHRSRFFGFFSLCVSATVGIALADDLVTFLVFYELLTLATYPLVAHRGTDASLDAAGRYLVYTLTGGGVLLVATAWLYTVTGEVAFREQGFLSAVAEDQHGILRAIFALFVIGFGVKAALVPLHGWLPRAMVAPAPVSALLHAVAVVKAGVFGIVRLVADVYGIEFSARLGLLGPLAAAACVTIIYGSIRALAQDDLKRRLAFSTVSQVSYVTLGIAMGSPVAALGGIVHLVHQGVMKITLFFCAGNLAETEHIHKISEMAGVGRRMPWTMAAFTVAAFGMIGVPPVAGFISKWHLASGAVEAGSPWLIAVLLASSVLNATYFLPILHTAWFGDAGLAKGPDRVADAGPMLLVPALVTASFSLAFGLLAGAAGSPLDWASLIVLREFGL